MNYCKINLLFFEQHKNSHPSLSNICLIQMRLFYLLVNNERLFFNLIFKLKVSIWMNQIYACRSIVYLKQYVMRWSFHGIDCFNFVFEEIFCESWEPKKRSIYHLSKYNMQYYTYQLATKWDTSKNVCIHIYKWFQFKF